MKKLFKGILIFLALCGFHFSSAQTFNPVADSYVRNGSYANSNYGSLTSFDVKQSTISGNTRHGFLKFDLTGQGITSVTSAKLRIYLSSGSSSSVGIYRVGSTWTETGITWNNMPPEGAQAAVKSLTSNKIYLEWDVTSYFISNLDSGRTVISFMVKDLASGSTMTFNSRTATTNKPQLVITVPQVPTVPAAPSALTALAVSSSQINLGWTDNSNNETGFIIEGKTGSGAFAQIGSVAAGVTSFSHTGLSAGVAYTYRVYAYNAVGNSAYSNEAAAQTLTLPAAPSGLTAAAVASGQINLSWADNASNESGYKVEAKTGANAFALVGTTAAGATAFSHTGLSSGTTYSYRVYAFNGAGNSAYSNEAAATTPIPSGPEFYIDAVSGNDNNTGTTSAAPWKNISKLNTRTLVAGTKVFLKAGSVWTGQQLKFLGSGTAAAPIMIDRYGTGAKPILNGNGLLGQGVIYLYNQEFIEIRNLEVTNLPTGASFFVSSTTGGGDRRGVMVVIDNYGTADHIYLKNLDIHHVKGQLGSGETAVNGAIPKRTGGIFFTVLGASETNNAKSRFNDVLIDSCNIYYCENVGFAIDNEWNVYYPGGQFSTLSADRTEYQNWFDRRNTNLVIRNSVFHHIGKNAMIIRMADETGLIEKNVCYETALGTTGNTMFTARCKGTVFQFNEGYFNRATTQTVNSGTIDGSMYDADYGSVGVIFQYSYSHDNSEGLYWGCNTRGSANNTSGVPDPGDSGVTVRYNISQNDLGDLVFFNYPSAGNEIYNNVFYIGSGKSPNIIHESSKQHRYNYFNNIIYNLSSTADYSFKDTGQIRNISHNVFYGNHPTGTLTAEPADPFKITADPLLVNPGSGLIGLSTLSGYRLQSVSPALNSGRVVNNNGGRDFYGNSLYQGNPDRGAHEFASVLARTIAGRSSLFRVYPNPSSGDFTVRLPGYLSAPVFFRVYDEAGKMVYVKKGNANSVMHLAHLPSGIYVLRISDAAGTGLFSERIAVE